MSGQVFVPGRPVPQGSAKAFVVKGRAVVTSDNAKTNPWRADIHAAVRAVVGDRIAYPEGPVALVLGFAMPRRASEPKRVTPPHTRKPDGDKLLRAVMDALTGLVYTDDAQVTSFVVDKRTAEIGVQPGVLIWWGEPAALVPRRWATGIGTERAVEPPSEALGVTKPAPEPIGAPPGAVSGAMRPS